MRADRPFDQASATAVATPLSLRDRILGDVDGPQDEALVFAASSIINEITSASFEGGSVTREVRTESGAYTLRGTRVSRPDGFHPVVLVYTEAVDVTIIASPKQQLRDRFGLTHKESEVALLLVAQKSNDQIAEALFISRHTARHHTQSVLGKLGVKSRREVAAMVGVQCEAPPY